MKKARADLPGKRVQGKHCFVCGKENPRGLNIPFYFDGDSVTGRFVPDDRLCGFEGVVHGAVIFALADEAMMHLIWAKELRAVTADVNIRFHNYAKTGQALSVEARIESLSSKLIKGISTVRDHKNRKIATAHGKFLRITEKGKFEKAF